MKKLIFIFIPILLFLSCNQKTEESYRYMPVDKNATKETIILYNKLFSLMDKGIMLGHQDDLAYGHSWYREEGRSDVKDVVGDYPAIVGWELGHIEIGADFNLDSVYFHDMKRYIKETYARGGITTASWHGDNIVTGNTSWDCAQDSVVRTILPNGTNHIEYLAWLDRLADFFLDLTDEQGNYIPVIFRMYHEHTGAWFWWGSEQCTPDEYKQLWIMTLKYLRDEKNVHNLLFAYSPSATDSEAEFLERYPGDEYVDIVGFDYYLLGDDVDGYKDIMDKNLKIVTEYASKAAKIPVIGETGMESIPDTTYFTKIVYPLINQYEIAWVLFWRNAWEADKPHHYYTPYIDHPSASDFKEFSEKSNILSNKDIVGQI